MEFDRETMARTAAGLAERGVFIGTSSWKYPGWRGTLYRDERYLFRGKFAESRFEKGCLAEYGEVFKTVGVDFTYYAFPRREVLEGMAAQVPPDFLFGFKVTDEITVKRFPKIDRLIARAGQPNPNFLNADFFAESFLEPCRSIRGSVGVLMFEFSRFHPEDYRRREDFLADLDAFLGKLPPGWPYAVEIRNAHFLGPDYFACLSRHGVGHVFNSWDAMPSVQEQMAMPGSRTCPGLVAARFLLRPGRPYQEAKRTFEPYHRTQEVNVEARAAGAALIKTGREAPDRSWRTLLYVNNRLEGNALNTLVAMADG